MAKILIIDDDINIRNLFSALLSPEHTVYSANNGKEGLHLFTLHHPDLVITDLHMPFMSGVELIQNLRASRNRVRIIACSAFLSRPESNAAIKEGVDLCLAKPVEMAALKKAVNDLLS